MKKLLLSVFLLGISSYFVNSQNIVITTPQCKNVVLEEYTGIHCGYCPQGHKIADSLSQVNPGRVVIVNIHQGVFAVPSAGQPDFRTPFGDALATQAAVNSYPAATVNRHLFPGLSENGGTTMGRGKWFAAAGQIFPEQSPVNIGFSSTYDTSTKKLTIKVEAYYTKNSPLSTNYLNVALLENHVYGFQEDYADGNQSNYDHKHILRYFLTGQWGDVINTTTKGTLITKTYTYTVPDTIKINNCDISVYISESHQEVYTGVVDKAIGGYKDGSTLLYMGDLDYATAPAAKGTPSNTSNFILKAQHSFANNQNYRFYITKKIPSGWTSTLEDNTIIYSDSADVTINSGSIENLTVHITPDNSPGVGTVILSMKSLNYPDALVKVREVYLISNVTDLLVNNDASWGNPSDTTTASSFMYAYLDGLNYSACNSYGIALQNVLLNLSNANALTGVKNMYFNVGWSFPSLTDSNVKAFKKFLDKGGNLFISGQDIGWETWNTTNPFGDSATQGFYTHYLNASWKNDGSTTNNMLRAITTNSIFGAVGNSSIVNMYGSDPGTGTEYMYPDQIKDTLKGVPVFYYNSTPSSVAAVMAQNGFKTVYFGVSLEMISDKSIRNQIMKLTYEWFNGLITSAEIKNAMCQVGQNYPNPASNYTVIPLDNINNDMTLQIFDLNGKIISVSKVNSGSRDIKVDCSGMSSGIYFYKLTDGKTITDYRKFEVNR